MTETMHNITFWSCNAMMLLSVSPMSSMKPFHFSGQDNQKEMKMPFYHVISLAPALASCDTNGFFNETTAFL